MFGYFSILAFPKVLVYLLGWNTAPEFFLYVTSQRSRGLYSSGIITQLKMNPWVSALGNHGFSLVDLRIFSPGKSWMSEYCRNTKKHKKTQVRSLFRTFMTWLWEKSWHHEDPVFFLAELWLFDIA